MPITAIRASVLSPPKTSCRTTAPATRTTLITQKTPSATSRLRSARRAVGFLLRLLRLAVSRQAVRSVHRCLATSSVGTEA